MYIRQYTHFEWSSLRWFNVSAPMWILHWGRRSFCLCLWTLFNRRCADGDHYWGAGVLQIGNRYLFAVMFSGVSILFIGRIP